MKIEEAADYLGVPKASLRVAAQAHGLIVKMGKAIRIDRDCLSELIERCPEKPLEPVFTGAPTRKFGSSGTPAALTNLRAHATVAMLKKL